ncbi:hypothetical protein ACN267_18820 [Micromonospora sp. WMMD734]|uniref:hypothetical protein n=1 Tax=Micromonospora sp. WMMD734 TaxID=3404129 RepID=UPI003B9362EC
MNINRVAAGLVAIVAVVALAACTSTPSGTPAHAGEPSTAPPPHLLRSVELRLPIEDYLPTAEQRDRLGTARLRLIQKCLARFDVRYPVKAVPGSAYGPRSETDRRYGITDLALARTDGYGLGTRDPARAGRPANPVLDADGITALHGTGRSTVRGQLVPAGGCVGEADDELARQVPAGVDVAKASRLQMWSFEESKRDSRVTAAFRAWSDCMQQAGFSYADPLSVMGDPAFEADAASSQEIAVATRDIHCKGEANVVGIWFTVESAYQRREIDSHRAAYDAIRQAVMARDQFAGQVS